MHVFGGEKAGVKVDVTIVSRYTTVSTASTVATAATVATVSRGGGWPFRSTLTRRTVCVALPQHTLLYFTYTRHCKHRCDCFVADFHAREHQQPADPERADRFVVAVPKRMLCVGL